MTTVRAATAADAAALAAIYNHYVVHTVVTFEEDIITVDEMRRRMDDVASASLPWLVAEHDGCIAGYAYATNWRTRSGYRFSAEATVYLAPEAGRRGIGSHLYGELFPLLKARGMHAVVGGIALPNEGSVALHEKFGMTQVAHFKETGFKFGRWVDVGYWEVTL